MRRAVIGISILQLSREHAPSNGGRQAIVSARNDSYLSYLDRLTADQDRHLALLRRLVEPGDVRSDQLIEAREVVSQPGSQLLQPRRDDLVRRLGVGKSEAEAQRLQPVLEAVQVVDVVLPGVPLNVGIVQAVLELLERPAQLARLAQYGCGRRRVAGGVVPQGLLRVLELRLEAHDAVEHL